MKANRTLSAHAGKRFHREPHRLEKAAWLRAAVLGANDGIISTASLLVGVASANATHATLFLTGLAGLVAGAMSMATGEYISVSSQADLEDAAIAQEQAELVDDYSHEVSELAHIYVRRGLDVKLAKQVAEGLMAHDALGAHAKDELGICEINAARPMQAAAASALSFTSGAALPLLMTWLTPVTWLAPGIGLMSLAALGVLGAVSAKIAGANVFVGVRRVLFWGAISMAFSAMVGGAVKHWL